MAELLAGAEEAVDLAVATKARLPPILGHRERLPHWHCDRPAMAGRGRGNPVRGVRRRDVESALGDA